MSSTEPVRWGIISGARIGLNSVAPAIQQSSNARIVCIGTPRPDESRARSAPVRECAEKLGIPRIYDNYAAVLADPEVEAVYIPLPNSMHREWTLRAAEAGKHVLCEKPFAATAAECREMIEGCRKHGVLLMEAFMYRFHPQQTVIRDVLQSGRLGAIQMVRGGSPSA
jgi:predicted dehydrogenase